MALRGRTIRRDLAASAVAAAVGLGCGAWSGAARAADKAAVFAAELHDPSLAYGRKSAPAELRRLGLVTDELRRALADKAGIESVDLAPQAEEIGRQSPLYKCNSCVPDIARTLGADLAVTTLVEKGAGQIFNLDVTIAEAATGKVVRNGLVVIRANTDDDWTHAIRWVVKNRLLAEPLPGRS